MIGEPIHPKSGTALMHDYRRLVALAYLTLPVERGRHSRVLTAHAAVRRSLPTRWRRPANDMADLREHVLRTALAGRRTALPQALGIRLFPPAVDGDETAYDQALRTLDGPARAAWALRALWGCPEPETVRLLRGAGVAQPDAAVAAATAVPAPQPGGWDDAGLPPAFDACRVQVRQTERTPRRVLAAAVLTAGLLAGAAALAPGLPGRAATPRPGSADALPGPPAGLAAPDTVAADAWRHTARIDFTTWPARGDRRTDHALLDRALTAWRTAGNGAAASLAVTPGPAGSGGLAGEANPAGTVGVAGAAGHTRSAGTVGSAGPAGSPGEAGTAGAVGAERAAGSAATVRLTGSAGSAGGVAEPGTGLGPPVGAVRVLFAGDVDGVGVVLLYDSTRIARWSEDEGLRLARADSSDVTTAAAVVLRRSGGSVRYLLAPWIAEARTRRLERPDEPARALAAADGVTGPVPADGRAGCAGGTVLQLRSSPQIAEQHFFALADVGGLLPAHLTYTPPPEQGPARAPREAVGPEALRAWAVAGCAVPDASPGVRGLNLWAFAVQPLPADAGRATWLCLRADRWAGDGSAATAVLLPGEAAARRTGGAEGRACSRFEQDTVGWTWWRSPGGEEFLLAAGSRKVARIEASGPGWQADGRTLAVRRPGPSAPVRVEARLESGTRLAPLG